MDERPYKLNTIPTFRKGSRGSHCIWHTSLPSCSEESYCYLSDLGRRRKYEAEGLDNAAKVLLRLMVCRKAEGHADHQTCLHMSRFVLSHVVESNRVLIRLIQSSLCVEDTLPSAPCSGMALQAYSSSGAVRIIGDNKLATRAGGAHVAK